MHRPRYTLANLVAVVAISGVGFAALNGGYLWFSGLFTATIVLRLVAALGAMFRRGPARAFFTGAVLCGSVYLSLVYVATTCNLLLTDKFLRVAADWVYGPWPSPPPSSAPVAAHANYQEFLNNYVVNWNGTVPRTVFAGVGHLLFSWLFAVGGGLVARAFATRDWPQVELAVDRVNSPREQSAEADEHR